MYYLLINFTIRQVDREVIIRCILRRSSSEERKFARVVVKTDSGSIYASHVSRLPRMREEVSGNTPELSSEIQQGSGTLSHQGNETEAITSKSYIIFLSFILTSFINEITVHIIFRRRAAVNRGVPNEKFDRWWGIRTYQIHVQTA